MTWLTPLGFLSLIGLIVLIIIYIIKPNYQQKVISSTFVWRLSLKYRKKRLPINKLHNILLFLCQVLILTISALLLAQPVISTIQMGNEDEKVIIIDASASMMVSNNGKSRFEKAVDRAKDVAEETVKKGGLVSVVLADADPEFVVQRMSEDNLEDLQVALDMLLADGTKCTYGSADMQEAVTLAEEVLRYNSEAQVHLYTATNYIEKNGIMVENMSGENEWNAAIMGVNATYNDFNYYDIAVDVGCFGRTEYLTIYCKVHGVNGDPQKVEEMAKTEFFDPTEEEKTVFFTTDDFTSGVGLYAFDYLEVYVTVEDSLSADNSFFLYGGTKQPIKIQYASSKPNNYFGGMIRSMRETMKSQWDIEFTELKADKKAATEGFDLYIFEHRMPDVMPTDGVVLLVDPGKAPEGSGLQLGNVQPVSADSTLASGANHAIMNWVEPNRITIARYTEVLASDGYEELAYYNGKPMILVKNEDGAKVMVWAFDLNYSNLCLKPDFTFLMMNMFRYFIPTTMDANSYEIGDTVNLQARGTGLTIAGQNLNQTFEGKEGQVVVTQPGTYTVTQMPMQGDQLIIENFFVGIPNFESDITKEVDALPIMNVDRNMEFAFEDLLFYFAIALVAFMFIEWILQTKKNY